MFIAHRHSKTSPAATDASFQFFDNSLFGYYDDAVVQTASKQEFRSFSEDLNSAFQSGRSVQEILKGSSDTSFVWGVLGDFNHEFTDRTRAIALDFAINKGIVRFNQTETLNQFVEFLPLADETVIKHIGGIQRLRDVHRHLSDEIMDLWGDTLNYHLKRQGKSVFVMKTWAFMLMCIGDLDISKTPEVSRCKVLILPVNVNQHWVTVQIIRRDSLFRLHVLDSLGKERPEVVQNIQRWILEVFKGKANFDVSYLVCPQQNNNFDCGIYTCMNMAYSAWGRDFDYTSADIPLLRKWMLYYLTNHISVNTAWTLQYKENFLKDYSGESSPSVDRARRSRSPESSSVASNAAPVDRELLDDLMALARRKGWSPAELRDKAEEMGISIPDVR